MTESTTSGKPNIYDRYPEPVDTQYILSEKELSILEQSGLAVKHPVPQAKFVDIEHFRKRSNNFFLFFSNSFAGMTYKESNVYKRFLAIRAVQVNLLSENNEKIANALRSEADNNATEINYELISELYSAYVIMSALVDIDDYGVMITVKDPVTGETIMDEETGKPKLIPDYWFLCR